MGKRYFGVVRWCNEDIANKLKEMGIKPTRDNIAAVRTICENDHHFTDGMIEAGWYAIENAIDEADLDETLEPAQNVTPKREDAGKNTRVNYLYRDASNYKLGLSEVLRGRISESEMEDFNRDFDGANFYPAKLGLDASDFESRGYSEYPDDPDFHEFAYLEYSDENPTALTTIQEFVEKFPTAKARF